MPKKIFRSNATEKAVKVTTDSFAPHPKNCPCSGCVGPEQASLGRDRKES